MENSQNQNNLMSTINMNNNDANAKESHNRNLTTKEIYSLFGPLMITHKIIELDENFTMSIFLNNTKFIRVISAACEEMYSTLRENGWN